jgi:ubiquitin-activating enzyme E1
MKVIILGMGGLGVEIAKNIILSGVSEISFFDDKICSISDLSSNFYISEEDINRKRRDEACLPNLRELNREIIVNKFESLEIMKNNIKNFDILVITEILDTKDIIE